MTFEEAETKLYALAEPGTHVFVQYARTRNSMGGMSQECYVYIGGVGLFRDLSWDAAFAQLDAALNPRPLVLEDPCVDELKPQETKKDEQQN